MDGSVLLDDEVYRFGLRAIADGEEILKFWPQHRTKSSLVGVWNLH
jgi:hypothetical protein